MRLRHSVIVVVLALGAVMAFVTSASARRVRTWS
jgi:hypothetical protein